MPNDTCSGAIDAGNGQLIQGRIDEFTPEYNSNYNGCAENPLSGPEAVYYIDAVAGEVVSVELNAPYDAGVWVTTDCSDAANQCVAGSDRFTAGGSEVVHFVAPTASRYYIMADSRSRNATGQFALKVDRQMPSCTPGETLGCLSSSRLEYCHETGIPLELVCSGQCVNDACTDPQGQICADAIPLVSGGTYTGSFTTVNSFNPGSGTQGSCSFSSGDIARGRDTVYEVSLLAGEVLSLIHI